MLFIIFYKKQQICDQIIKPESKILNFFFNFIKIKLN